MNERQAILISELIFAFLQPYNSTESRSGSHEGVKYVACADTAHIAREYRERKTEREKERRFVLSPYSVTPSPALIQDGQPPPAPPAPAPAGSGSWPGTEQQGTGLSFRRFVFLYNFYF